MGYDRLPRTCDKLRFFGAAGPKKELDKALVESVEFAPLLNMKNSPLMTIFLALLAISAVLSLIFFWKYNSRLGELRGLQFQVNQINQKGVVINQMMNDVLEYSKRTTNRDIDRLLETFGVTNRPPAK